MTDLTCMNRLTRPVRDLGLALGADLAYRVDAASLAFKIDSNQDLAEQSGSEHHETSQQQEATEEHEWTVLGNDVQAADFLNQKEQHHKASEGCSGEAQRAEEVHRAGEILQQETDREDVE